MKGLIIRSKAKWTEEGEKCSKYFMNLEKRNICKKSITDLIDTDGNVVKNQEELINLQVQYYKGLYKKNEATLRHSYESFVENVDIKELSPENKESCEGLLDINECKVSLDKMANNKSPGCDGLTAEFYKRHWNLVGQLVVNSFNEAYENNELSSSHKRGIITLIHKGKGLPRNNLDYWRPITLLNIDYQIAAKALASRINRVLPTIIDSDQNGFICKHGAALSIRLIEDILRYTEKNDIEGAMICLDFRKAFDTIKRDFILYAFESFNFGESVKKWITTLFCNTVS